MDTRAKVNILVVDDLPEKLMAMELILEELGQNVVTAQSGREALRKLLTQDFAVILLDVNMPDMDGFETARLIRQRKRTEHTPIIFVTGFSDELHAARGYSLGAVDYILSPVVPEVLRTKVGVFVDLSLKTEQVRRQAEERVALAQEQAARAVAEEAKRRSDFLARSGVALSESLDLDATLRGLLGVVVPHLADVAGVTLVGDAGQPWRSELAWVCPPDPTVHSGALTGQDGPADELRAALERVLASGAVETLDGLDVPYPPAACAAGAPGPETRLRSAAGHQRQDRGRTLGALTLAVGGSGRSYGPSDLGLAKDLAHRAAIAIDNARLYRDIQEADHRKNEFLAMLAHELRNPLAPIRNAVELLRAQGLPGDELTWARDVIDRQVRQMVRLVDDLLDVSRITRGKVRLQKEPVELAAVVASAVETCRPLIEARRHDFTVELPPETVWLMADPARLAQVLANLLNNAAKYTEEGGRIWLTARRDGDTVRLSVRDTGMGIPAEMLGSVFDMFTQVDNSLERAHGGLGIGLTLVHRLVELHGGRAEAHSEGAGRGSEFVVTLSGAVTTPPATAPAKAAPNGHVRAARRVLVVDDNVDAARSLSLLLRANGHAVHVEHDGPAALTAAATFRPDVVLLDIGLPGMSGYDVARRLRGPEGPGLNGVRLIALTGFGQDEDRKRSQEAGFDHHLVKPVDPERLHELLAAGTPTAV